MDSSSAPFLTLLSRLGPISRYFIRPFVRLLRRTWALTVGRLGGRHEVLRSCLIEAISVLWVPLAIAVSYGLRYWLF